MAHAAMVQVKAKASANRKPPVSEAIPQRTVTSIMKISREEVDVASTLALEPGSQAGSLSSSARASAMQQELVGQLEAAREKMAELQKVRK